MYQNVLKKIYCLDDEDKRSIYEDIMYYILEHSPIDGYHDYNINEIYINYDNITNEYELSVNFKRYITNEIYDKYELKSKNPIDYVYTFEGDIKYDYKEYMRNRFNSIFDYFDKIY